MNNNLNDTNTTDGVYYRIPSHPAIISALGRCLYNYLALEESVVAIIYEADETALTLVRTKMGNAKVQALTKFTKNLQSNGAPQHLIDTLEKAIAAFDTITRKYRNAIAHATPFTAGKDESGSYMPGLFFRIENTYLYKPDDLHRVALAIEEAIDPLGNARMAVREYIQSTSKK
ncbi:hypothetical protein [Chitinophaga pinensis]|uniref:Uncharacterized protein n=1 Tax=Chitinophaga pinensis (strain ATCC 43595 / DSM 2588 / LMG 13176 / NBRC 15968 / NCIMB 11800 / UQM 2034) TaxID=485918 RepID=A0A979GUZ7_CHIPD|nr:hypothetical protein [Chitinophaga pinensis]ACU60711.1 hypothetical protein Cpin_3244 [Chitinophaga pinensis DSM 2588]